MIDEMMRPQDGLVERAQTKALAEIIVRLLNDSEPLLTARRIGDGAQVVVEEKGGPGRFTFAVVPSVPGSEG